MDPVDLNEPTGILRIGGKISGKRNVQRLSTEHLLRFGHTSAADRPAGGVHRSFRIIMKSLIRFALPPRGLSAPSSPAVALHMSLPTRQIRFGRLRNSLLISNHLQGTARRISQILFALPSGPPGAITLQSEKTSIRSVFGRSCNVLAVKSFILFLPPLLFCSTHSPIFPFLPFSLSSTGSLALNQMKANQRVRRTGYVDEFRKLLQMQRKQELFMEDTVCWEVNVYNGGISTDVSPNGSRDWMNRAIWRKRCMETT